MKNKCAIVIQARLSSTRLPKKVLMPLGDRQVPIILYMINRLRLKTDIPIIVAIPDNEANGPLRQTLKQNAIDLYQGSENDLISRYLDCGKAFNLQTIVRLTADCPLVDPILVNKLTDIFHQSNVDYLGNTTPPDFSTFPDGSDIEIFSFKALSRASNLVSKMNFKYREHVTFQFWDGDHSFSTLKFDQEQNFSNLRFTLDNIEDLQLIKKIVQHFESLEQPYFSTEEIQEFLTQRPDLQKINEIYSQGDNW